MEKLQHLSLRLRVFLFFLLIALGGIAVIAAALYLGLRRSGPDAPTNGFILAGTLSVFGLTGLVTLVWYLFDENVARPIENLSAALRARAHAGVDVELDADQLCYLGDLAPAAQAVTGQLSQSTMDAAETVARETARLEGEKERLTALLTEIPMAMVLINPAHQITLYDGQAAQVLGSIHMPRLNAPIFDYFDREAVLEAHGRMLETGQEVSGQANGTEGNLCFDIRLKPLGHAPGYMLLIEDTHALIAPEDTRPLVYDFDLAEHAGEVAIEQTPLSALTYVVFDTETTGLHPLKDEIVQIGAVRVVNGRMVPGEAIDQLVNPGMAIPPASTKVHKITDGMVADAPGIDSAARQFHGFARGAVIVAHNAPFDMAFLRRHGKASGLEWEHPILDTVLLSAVLFGTTETHTLDALCDRLGVVIPPALRHTALGDAHATAEVLCKMLPILKSRGFTTFGDVIAQTRKHGRLLQDLN